MGSQLVGRDGLEFIPVISSREMREKMVQAA